MITKIIAKINEKIDCWHKSLLVAIFIIAAVFRIVGIGWGMPYDNLHPDEGIVFWKAYQCTLDHTFEVNNYYYRPNHVIIKLSTLLYTGIQELYFAPQGMTNFELNFTEHFPLFIIASRMVTVAFSMGIIALAYLIARFWGKRQALLTALLFAVYPSFIEHSHYITPDIPLLFFLMLALWSALCYLKKPSAKWLFWMSFATAFGVCEKYPGLYGCAIIAAVVIIARIKKPLFLLRDGVFAFLFLILGILAVSPVLLIDYKRVLEIMAGQNHQYHIGADGLNFPQSLWYYTKTTAEHMGLILTVSGLYGIVKSIRKHTWETLILLTLPTFIIPISMLSLHFERYGLPIYAGALIFGCLGLFYVTEDLKKLLAKKVLVYQIVNLVLLLLPFASLTIGSMAFSGNFLAPDSRIFLQDIFDKMDITSDNTVFDCNTPLDPGGFYGAFSSFEDADPERYKYGRRPYYIMTSSGMRDLFLESDADVYGWIANFYRALDENYELVYYFPVEMPSYHFLEVQNMWYNTRSVYRYLFKGGVRGFEIRVYH